MSMMPRSSPWGEVQRCEKLIDGVFLVSTAGHGGVMVRKSAAGFLSPEARKIAQSERNYLCFEEDCDEAVAMRELLDKKLWEPPDRIGDKTGYEAAIDNSLKRWHPRYWEKREKTMAAQSPPSSGGAPEPMRDARNDIIFRDANYDVMFKIKDGDSIKITVAYDGEELVRKCRWLDETHLNVGDTCFHVDEFMEKQMKVGNRYEPVPGQEPVIDVVIAEPGKPPRYAELPMNRAAIREAIGGEPVVVGEDRFYALVRGGGGNGTVIAFGIKDGNLTSLHPYTAQTLKRELAAIVAAMDEKPALTLASRLEAGKAKAAAHAQSPDKTHDSHQPICRIEL